MQHVPSCRDEPLLRAASNLNCLVFRAAALTILAHLYSPPPSTYGSSTLLRYLFHRPIPATRTTLPTPIPLYFTYLPDPTATHIDRHSSAEQWCRALFRFNLRRVSSRRFCPYLSPSLLFALTFFISPAEQTFLY